MFADRFEEAWNRRDPQAVAALYAPDGRRVQIAFPPDRIEGRAALAEHVGAIMSAWPDFVLTTRAKSTGDDGRETYEWTFAGTQQADYGPLPAKGQRLELQGVSIIELAGDLVREERVYWDTGTLLASADMFPGMS
jgi:steroid delta-isomerase-like uncharacterized protein